MATMKLIKNGTRRAVANPRKRRKSTKRRRRNPATPAVAVRTASVRRNPAPVARKVANPRKRRKTVRRRRRNGVLSKKNGLFGDSRETVRSVVSLLAGLAITRVESGILTPTVARPLAMVGLQNFAQPITEAALAVTINKWAATQLSGRDSGKFVMIGGLAMAAMSAIQQLLPQTSAYNPFASANTSPVVVNQPVINSDTVKALTNAAAREVSAKVNGALDSINSQNLASASPYNTQRVGGRGLRMTY